MRKILIILALLCSPVFSEVIQKYDLGNGTTQYISEGGNSVFVIDQSYESERTKRRKEKTRDRYRAMDLDYQQSQDEERRYETH